jgi:hypothetical protein
VPNLAVDHCRKSPPPRDIAGVADPPLNAPSPSARAPAINSGSRGRLSALAGGRTSCSIGVGTTSVVGTGFGTGFGSGFASGGGGSSGRGSGLVSARALGSIASAVNRASADTTSLQFAPATSRVAVAPPATISSLPIVSRRCGATVT